MRNDFAISTQAKTVLPLRKDLRQQQCSSCGFPMGDMPGSRDAICTNCGYKDPCCE